ncbi:hypothetical protein EYF80_045620 [Liparis tanakae]|uniref:Uncharacterized protein n=1 Tax=Liparis tanakae TaxID=230148 RepID=A0A4Z2FTJ2_9TELE|nr:hypothetical protein EYF80_045620 [Liparis tanakae]
MWLRRRRREETTNKKHLNCVILGVGRKRKEVSSSARRRNTVSRLLLAQWSRESMQADKASCSAVDDVMPVNQTLRRISIVWKRPSSRRSSWRSCMRLRII